MLGKAMQIALGTAVLAGAAVGGAAVAGAATSNNTTTTTLQTAKGHRPPAMQALKGLRPGTAAHENAEKAVTGDAATKAQAAAVKAVGSGTAGDVTTDYRGSGYEVTVTKSDGSTVEIHLDSSFNVLKGPGACHGGPPPGSSN
jgi:hypothetical protein